MKRILSSIAVISCITTAAFSQTNDWCGTYKRFQDMLSANPQMQVEHDSIENWLHEHEDEDHTSSRAVKIIPVVVHIIHNYGSENISDARVVNAIKILNEDFKGTSPDLADVVPSFTGIVNNPQFEFRLATLDPSGNCTNGITRTVSTLTYDATDASKLVTWPRNKYYNIWVVFDIATESATSVTAGYSYLPSGWTNANVDGTIIAYNYFGNAVSAFQKRVLSHETGHWFNLQHTFGNVSPGTGDCSGNDNVSDTPPTSGSFSTCVLSKDDCGPLANVQNIMDYSSCTNMFTTGQSNRMINAANSATAQRSNLWTGANLTSTGTADPYTPSNCAPIADFYANKYTICKNNPIVFHDVSYQATVNSRLWTFTNGTTTINDTNASPTINFTEPGEYAVTLLVSGSAGNNSVTRTAYVYVYDDVAEFASTAYYDDFENGPATNNRWSVLYSVDPADGWRETNLAYVSTNTSMMVHNYALTPGQEHTMYSPSYDFTSTGFPPVMNFKLAYARRNSDNNDILKIYASSNCGQTWLLRGTYTADDMVTGGIKTVDWYPNALQWKTISLANLNSFAGRNNVRFKFEFTTNGGNNLFIDDLNITGPLAIEEATNADLNMNIYPNPVQNEINIDFTVDKEYDATFRLVDLTGKSVAVLGVTQLVQGDNHFVYQVPAGTSKGLYFLQVETGSKTFTHKIIIQ